ncbi:unnamed protein product [Closterium sp. NIES-54]
MYALTDSAEGDCYLSVPSDPGVEAAALGASASAAPGTGEPAAQGAGESALSGTAPTQALHTFTLDSGASRSFFRDSTTLTPLSRLVAVSLADPSGDPVLAHSSTVLPCPVAPSGLLSGLHLPAFSTNLVSGADLQDAWVDQFAPGGQRVTHCTCSRMGRHLATFTCRPRLRLYTLTTASGQVAASNQVFATASRSSPASAPCSCRPLSHETLLWHHRLGHPSLPRLRGMASRTLVSGLPRSLPPLPPGPAPTCVPFVEGRQRAAPPSSTFPPTEAPLQTLHMDVWGPARVRGQGHEHYFLLVVDDYSRYTTVFPLRSKGEVTETFTLPASPQQNGIAERRIGMVMDVARTSMIHAAAPHFLWPIAVQYAVHQINLQPRVSLPETTPTLQWTGKVGDASVFRFYHPTSRRVLSSQDVTFDESVSYYRLFPYRTASLPPPPLFLAPGTPPVDPFPPQGPAPSGVSKVDPAEPVEVAVDSGTARGVEPAGAWSGGAEPGGAEPERVEPGGAKSGGAESGRAEPGGAEPERVEPGVTASELQKRHTCIDLGELTSYLGLRITRDRVQRTITLTQSHMVQQVLQRFGFTYSSPQSTPLPTGHSLSAPPSDESVEPSGPYPELVGCLMYLMTRRRPDLAYPLSLLACYVAPSRHRKVHWDAAKRVLRYLCSTSGMGLVLGGRARVVLTGHADASWVDDLATQRSSQGYTFSLGSGSVSWRSIRSSSVLSSSCEAEIYARAMAAQELRWLTYLLTDLGEAPRSPPLLYVDNKAMLALCQKHRLEHRTKHFAVRYFLARELQQRGQLRLAYVASQANTADVFTKALQPCDHQRFCTVLGLVPTVPHLLTS